MADSAQGCRQADPTAEDWLSALDLLFPVHPLGGGGGSCV